MTTNGLVITAIVAGVAWTAGALDGPATRPAARFADPNRIETLRAQIARLVPLATKLAKPKPGDWLYEHKEPGQTFEQYVASKPVVPTSRHKTIYVQPLGRFNPLQQKIIQTAAEFLGIYYGLEVKLLDRLPLSVVPTGTRRIHPQWRDMQIRTGYVLEKVLLPRMPSDAFAYIALTTADLWPGEGWNFVFGSASPTHRVGVWSLYRYGDPGGGQAQYRKVLLRTLKTAAHEVGHMFSMPHCVAWQCGMCGSNGLAEADRRPIALCPQCVAKVCWATGADPADRYRRLAKFYEKHGLAAQAAFCNKALQALGQPAAGSPADTNGNQPASTRSAY